MLWQSPHPEVQGHAGLCVRDMTARLTLASFGMHRHIRPHAGTRQPPMACQNWAEVPVLGT